MDHPWVPLRHVQMSHLCPCFMQFWTIIDDIGPMLDMLISEITDDYGQNRHGTLPNNPGLVGHWPVEHGYCLFYTLFRHSWPVST